MKFDLKRIGLGVAVAAALLAVLAKFSSISASDFPSVSLQHAVCAMLFSMLTLAIRATNYRAIANQPVAAPLVLWMHVSLRHQFLFTVVPSGLGDIGFPVLARQYIGLDIRQGAGVIALARLRDLCFLPALGCGGLAVLDYAPILALLAACMLALLGLFLEQIAARLAGLLQRLGLKFTGHITERAPSLWLQLSRSGLTLCSWLSAALAVWCAYTAAGLDLGLATSFVMLAGLNAIGIIAISVGGLGVAEAGSAGVLVFLGIPFGQAAQVSLVARPILLISVLVACALWMIFVGMQEKRARYLS